MKKSIFIFICIFCLLAALPLAAQQSPSIRSELGSTNGNAWSTSVPAQAFPRVAASGSSTVYTAQLLQRRRPLPGKLTSTSGWT